MFGLLSRDLFSRRVRDIEHVNGLFTEGRDMSRGYVEAEVVKTRDRSKQKAGSVEGLNLDHGKSWRARIVDHDVSGTVKAPRRALGRLERTFCPSIERAPGMTSPNAARDFLNLKDFLAVLGIAALEKEACPRRAHRELWRFAPRRCSLPSRRMRLCTASEVSDGPLSRM